MPVKAAFGLVGTTAGALNRDAELKLHTRNHWNLAKVNMDFFYRQGGYCAN